MTSLARETGFKTQFTVITAPRILIFNHENDYRRFQADLQAGSWAYRAEEGGRGGGSPPPQFVCQTGPVGQYLLQSRANNCYTLTLV